MIKAAQGQRAAPRPTLQPGARSAAEHGADGVAGDASVRQEMRRGCPRVGAIGSYAYSAPVYAARLATGYTPRVIPQRSGAAVPQESARILRRQEPAAPEASLRPSRRRLATGVKLIVTYKLVKSLLEVVLAVAIPVLIVAGAAEHVHALALALRHHIISAWSTRLANLLVMFTTRRHLELTAIVLAFDGALTFVEGWSLWRGYAWGAWLVVIATGSLLPFEIRELVQGLRIGPLVVVIVNALVVTYLVGRAWRERRSHHGA